MGYLTSIEEDEKKFRIELNNASIPELRKLSELYLGITWSNLHMLPKYLFMALSPTNYTLKRRIAIEVLEKRLENKLKVIS